MKALNKGRAVVAAGVLAAMSAVPAAAHHSFSIFNMEQTQMLTGVVTRVNPDANHLQVFFAPMNDERKNVLRGEDGKPMIWAVEMAGSAQSAADGISVNALPPGTIMFDTDRVPYPLSGVDNVVQFRAQRNFYGTLWPKTRRRYEFGSYLAGVLQNYFPPAFGTISNIGNG